MAQGQLARGTRGTLVVRFVPVRMRVTDGPPQRIGDMGAQHLPGEEVWLVGEYRSVGERKYYLSSLPADTPIKRLAKASRPAGSANRDISNSRKSLATIVSKAGHGRDSINIRY